MEEALSGVATPIAGAALLERARRGDNRGFFERIYCATTLAAFGWQGALAQVNHSVSRQTGLVRGMHYQLPPHAEYKLVSCLRGAVYDVVLDLRRGSPTFLHWHGVQLSAENGRALLIPPGCAHGFQTLNEEVEMLYCHSAPYVPASEAGVAWDDARVQIAWPLAVTGMSDKDRQWPRLDAGFTGVCV